MTGGAQADEEPGFSISDACIAGVRFIGAPSPIPHTYEVPHWCPNLCLSQA